MIRIQQDQLAAIHRQQSQATEVSPSSAEHTRFPTPPSGLAAPTSTAVTEASSPAQSHATPAHPTQQHFNRPHSLSRRSSALISTPGSRGTSPALRPQSSNLGPLTEDFLLGGTRDETAFYQAETQNLTRENQMLKLRIRDLGRLIANLAYKTIRADRLDRTSDRGPRRHRYWCAESRPPTLTVSQPTGDFRAAADSCGCGCSNCKRGCRACNQGMSYPNIFD